MNGTPITQWDVWAQFGIAGMILGVFFVLVWMILHLNAKTIKGIVDRISGDAKDSNEQWRSTFVEHSNRADMRAKETNTVMRELTKAVEQNNSGE